MGRKSDVVEEVSRPESGTNDQSKMADVSSFRPT